MKKNIAGFLNSFLKAGLLACMLMPSVQAASLSWNAQQSSAAITTASARTVQVFTPPQTLIDSHRSATLGRVHISYRHGGRAVLKSRLCLQGGGPCVDMNGAVLNTDAFAGQDARRGFVLQHEVWSWAGSVLPVYVQAHLQVWYEQP